jgi:hypothetical protein
MAKIRVHRGVSRWIMLAVIAVAGGLALVLLLSAEAGKGVTVVSANVVNDSVGQRFVRGTVRNNTDRTLAVVALEVAMLDAEGGFLGAVGTRISSLGAGTVGPFEIRIPGRVATRFRISDIDCYEDRSTDNLCYLTPEFDVAQP